MGTIENQMAQEILELKNTIRFLLLKLEKLEEANELLKAANELLKEENETLRRKLGETSANSHKPPSSDGYGKKPAIEKEKGGKKGGQEGHKGDTLKKVESADKIEIHHACSCSECGRAFNESEVEGIIGSRQVFDIPTPKLEVTEHQIGVIKCCGKIHQGEYPAGVESPVQYGSRIKALSVFLSIDCKISFKRVSKLLSDLYGCKYNESTTESSIKRCYELLEPTEYYILDRIQESKIAHFDETGNRVNGKLHWVHVICTTYFTYMFVDEKRGHEAIGGIKSILQEYMGCAVHDCWGPYFKYKNASHALCNAHILRELQALKDVGSKWAEQMHKLLLETYKETEKGTKRLADGAYLIERYEIICENGLREEPPPVYSSQNRPKNTKGRNLLLRLINHQQAVLAFAFDDDIPFTNNQAERDIRCTKVKQKVSGGFRTFKGACFFARIQGVISTFRKHSLNIFSLFVDIFNLNFEPNIALQAK